MMSDAIMNLIYDQCSFHPESVARSMRKDEKQKRKQKLKANQTLPTERGISTVFIVYMV